MKNKLRKIVINDLEYLYAIANRFHSGTETNTLTVKIFLSGHQHTPLIIEFLTLDDYFVGQPLNSGIKLRNKKTNTENEVNLNEPGYIRQLILQGQKNGWSGINTIEKQDGLSYLEELGFEKDPLKYNHNTTNEKNNTGT